MKVYWWNLKQKFSDVTNSIHIIIDENLSEPEELLTHSSTISSKNPKVKEPKIALNIFWVSLHNG